MTAAQNGIAPRCRSAFERRRRRARRRLTQAVVTILLGLAIAVLVVGRHVVVQRSDGALPVADAESAPPRPPAGPTALRGKRPIYRYSIVPGGVYTPTELSTAIATDPIVREHYVGFNVARARVVRVERPRAVHVSYRLGDRVYWTRRKIWLRPGEALLTDGREQVRGRCGNRVADEIRGVEAANDEPTVAALDEEVPVDPPGIAPLAAYRLMFVEVPTVAPIPVAALEEPLPANPATLLPMPPALIVEARTPPGLPAGPVPEPATLALVGAGAASLVGRRWRHPRPGGDQRAEKANGVAP